LQVFPLADYYSFGILQSGIHWEWFKSRCSTLKGDWRYTSNTVFDSFPWPQNPSTKNINIVLNAAIKLRDVRITTMRKYDWSLRDLYKAMEDSDENPVTSAQMELDLAVLSAYGFRKKDSILKELLLLNLALAKKEVDGQFIEAPGRPRMYTDS
jgi:hypothetical protein